MEITRTHNEPVFIHSYAHLLASFLKLLTDFGKIWYWKWTLKVTENLFLVLYAHMKPK
jgi:hypothetical protein